MRLHLRALLGPSSAALAVLAWLVAAGDAQAATKTQGTQVRHGNLILRLAVSTSESTVSAEAKLTNSGDKAWRYYGGCAPPIVQIQVRDARGNLVSGWRPPRVQCFALTVKYLKPHGNIQKGVRFSSEGTFYVQVVVPLRVGKSFQTRDIKVVLP